MVQFRRVRPVRGAPALTLVALDGRLELVGVREVLLVALQRVQVLGIPEREHTFFKDALSMTCCDVLTDHTFFFQSAQSLLCTKQGPSLLKEVAVYSLKKQT